MRQLAAHVPAKSHFGLFRSLSARFYRLSVRSPSDFIVAKLLRGRNAISNARMFQDSILRRRASRRFIPPASVQQWRIYHSKKGRTFPPTIAREMRAERKLQVE